MIGSYLTIGIAKAFVIVATSLALIACGEDGGDSAPDAGARPPAAKADGYPVTIRNCGRTLTFDRTPSRTMLAYHPIAELFVGLGLADRAVGRVGFAEGSGLREPPLLPEQAAAFKAIPVVSKDVFPPVKEKMLGLRSDFFLAYGDFDYDPTQGRASVEQLNAAGTQVYSVICPPKKGEGGHEGESFDVVYRAIRDLGRIFNVRERAERRVEQMKQQLAGVKAKVADEDPVKVVFYVSGTGPLGVYGGAGLRQEMLAAAGATNAFAAEPRDYFEVSLEKVAAERPDAFVMIADYEEPTGRPDASDETRFLFKTFPNTPATRDRRVVVTDYAYTSPGWRNAQTVEDIARQLHPDAFVEPSETHQLTDE